jgi:hypothetical protein
MFRVEQPKHSQNVMEDPIQQSSQLSREQPRRRSSPAPLFTRRSYPNSQKSKHSIRLNLSQVQAANEGNESVELAPQVNPDASAQLQNNDKQVVEEDWYN